MIQRVDNYEEMSRIAAKLFQVAIQKQPGLVLGLATGTTPIGLYDNLVELYRARELDFHFVRTVNLDEYVGLTAAHVQSYRYFMNTHLFDRVNIQRDNTHLPDGMAPDLAVECKRYDEMVDSLGGIDLQLLGIGRNGHIGFNEPADVFSTGTVAVDLTDDTIDANARLFANAGEVPKKAISMGIKTIMLAKKVVLLATADKKDIVEKAFLGPITPRVPASILQAHQNVTVLLAKE